MVQSNLLVETDAKLSILVDRIFEKMAKAGYWCLEPVAQNIVQVEPLWKFWEREILESTWGI